MQIVKKNYRSNIPRKKVTFIHQQRNMDKKRKSKFDMTRMRTYWYFLLSEKYDKK